MSDTLEKLKRLEGIIAKKSAGADTRKLAAQAIATMRDSVNNNQAVMAEIINRISIKPKEFLVVRDAKGDISKLIPVYEDGR